MTRIRTNAGRLARRYRKRAQRVNREFGSGLRGLALTVNREAVERLSGSGSDPAGAYPVPVRSGHLRRSQDWELGRNRAAVFNTAHYAAEIHADRPYIVDAANAVDPTLFMATSLRRVMR